jgi:hypothetical protein
MASCWQGVPELWTVQRADLHASPSLGLHMMAPRSFALQHCMMLHKLPRTQHLLWHSDEAATLNLEYVALPRLLSCRPAFTAPKTYRLLFNLNFIGHHFTDELKMYDDDECETCDRKFVNQLAAIQHMDALDHWEPQFECETCDKRFRTQPAANQHMDDTEHWEPQFECETCDKRFRTQPAANQHMNAVNHHKQNHWPRL